MIKVLFLASNPTGTGKLDLDREFEVVSSKLKSVDEGRFFEVRSESHLTVTDLQDLLIRHRPHIVHFSGHGNEKGGIIAELPGAGATAVPKESLSRLFQTMARHLRTVKCVVLNACFSDESADAISESVPCVVGMSRAIHDESAVQFAAGFYLAIANGLTVGAAVDVGRDRIALLEAAQGDGDLPQVRASLVRAERYVIRDQILNANKGMLLHEKYWLAETRDAGAISRIDVALDVQLDRRVVVKTLVDRGSMEEFEKEARALARLGKHPNIVSIHGAWLGDEPPHYVREYIDGHSLAEELGGVGRTCLPIDFVHQVLAGVGDAMLSAAAVGIEDLGVEPDKVLIQDSNSGQHVGQPSRYSVVVYPAAGGRRHIRQVPLERRSRPARFYVPPEHASEKSHRSDSDRSNQYRLGILGYVMLLGSEEFERLADVREHSGGGDWPGVRGAGASSSCPIFLREAIERMIRVDPEDRFPSLREAVDAIRHRNLNVEIARDSFGRILNREGDEKDFFREFYVRLLKNGEIRSVFGGAEFPALSQSTPEKWQEQFGKLKESIVFLLAFTLLRETGEPKILTRVADMHCRMKGLNEAHFDYFGETLVSLVLEFDKGNYPGDLKSAWKAAIEPGLNYFKEKLRNFNQNAALHRPGDGAHNGAEVVGRNAAPPPETGDRRRGQRVRGAS